MYIPYGKLYFFVPLLTCTEVVFIFTVLRLLEHLELTFSDYYFLNSNHRSRVFPDYCI